MQLLPGNGIYKPSNAALFVNSLSNHLALVVKCLVMTVCLFKDNAYITFIYIVY